MYELTSEHDDLTTPKVHLKIRAGTINQLAQQLYEELNYIGYSLELLDVLTATIAEVQYYCAWATLDVQRKLEKNTVIDGELPLSEAEWAIIQPVVLNHCHCLQAQLMEATRSINGDNFGLSVSEAMNQYHESRKVLQHEAFDEMPATLGLFEKS